MNNHELIHHGVFGRRTRLFCAGVVVVFAALTCPAAELPVPQIEDLYHSDVPTDLITLADGRDAIYCRMWADAQSRTIRHSLWRVDDSGPPRPLETGEPDAFSPQISPDEKWIVFLSTRGFADGTPAFAPVSPYSDPAADIWLIPVSGGKAIRSAEKPSPMDA